jgi:hypothetical protein
MKKQALKEILAEPREDLVVDDQTEVVLEGEDELAARARRIVEIEALEDMQALRLVPEWLSERELQEAIVLDDEEARSLARGQMSAQPAPCGCDEEVAADMRPAKLTHRSEFQRAYVGIRKAYNPNLAKLMTEAGRSTYDPSDIQVAMVRGWYSRVQDIGIVMFPIWLFEDVVIGVGATLTLGPKEKGLHCGDLRIHVGGKLLIQGSGAKIYCIGSAQGDVP